MKGENLIFDIGFHKCEDLDFYLSKGYKVVAIDADKENIDNAVNKYSREIRVGDLILVNVAITESDNSKVLFNKSEFSAWSSIKTNIANRKDISYSVIEVNGMKLSSLFKEYGMPAYCKIDIEGYDIVALTSLCELEKVPQFISVETECIGEKEVIDEATSLATLLELKKVGYKSFKLIEQITLSTLQLGEVFYTHDFIELDKRKKFEELLNYKFPWGSSGPFGEDLMGKWIDFEEAQKTLLWHRNQYFQMPKAKNYGFWCDWHARAY